jgi:DNA-binding MarR family transcriptional regulator
MSVDPASLDLGSLALFTGLALQEEVLAALHQRGHPWLRFAHGFVFQHLIEGDRTVGELAERLEVSQQAASKAVAELEGLGYVERTADPGDRRVRRVGLSERGREAVAIAREERARQEASLAERHDPDAIAAARALLASVLQGSDAGGRVRGRRVRLPL